MIEIEAAYFNKVAKDIRKRFAENSLAEVNGLLGYVAFNPDDWTDKGTFQEKRR